MYFISNVDVGRHFLEYFEFPDVIELKLSSAKNNDGIRELYQYTGRSGNRISTIGPNPVVLEIPSIVKRNIFNIQKQRVIHEDKCYWMYFYSGQSLGDKVILREPFHRHITSINLDLEKYYNIPEVIVKDYVLYKEYPFSWEYGEGDYTVGIKIGYVNTSIKENVAKYLLYCEWCGTPFDINYLEYHAIPPKSNGYFYCPDCINDEEYLDNWMDWSRLKCHIKMITENPRKIEVNRENKEKFDQIVKLTEELWGSELEF